MRNSMDLLRRMLGRKETVKPLSLIDATTGMAFEMQIVQARAAAKQAENDYDVYMENLHVRYGAPAGEWTVKDWAQGFVRLPTPTEGNHA